VVVRREDKPPKIILKEVEEETYAGYVDICGRVEDDIGIRRVKVNDRRVKVGADGIFKHRVELSIGRNEIEVEVIDTGGHKDKKRVVVVRREDKPPKIILKEVEEETYAGYVDICGRVEDDIGIKQVEVNDREVKVGTDGRFKCRVELSIGRNEIEVEVIDTGGHKVKKRVVVIRRSVPKEEDVVVHGISKQWQAVLKNIYREGKYDKAVKILNEIEQEYGVNAFVLFYKGVAYYKRAYEIKSIVDSDIAVGYYKKAIEYFKQAYSPERRREFSRMVPAPGVAFNPPRKNIHDIRFYLAMSYYHIYLWYDLMEKPAERWKAKANDAFSDYFASFRKEWQNDAKFKSFWNTARRIHKELNK
jgi:ribosomal 50S subunit-recycling heat shock protein